MTSRADKARLSRWRVEAWTLTAEGQRWLVSKLMTYTEARQYIAEREVRGDRVRMVESFEADGPLSRPARQRLSR